MEGEGEDSLDLNYLTEEEQASILAVLTRDEELRQLDKGRVSELERTVKDPVRLRTQTGAWFNEERSKRHRRQAADLVQASMRRRSARTSKGKDVPLKELFNAQPDEAADIAPPGGDNLSLQTESSRLEEDSTTGADDRLPREPSSRSKKSHKDLNGNSSSTERLSRTNGHKGETEDDSDDHHDAADTDSVSSGETHPDPTPLKTTSSVGSLQSSYMLGGSMMSLFSSGEFGAVDVRGRVQFSLVHDAHKSELQIRVCRCEDLAPAHKNRSDPYVKTYLLPDKSSHSKKKTSVRKKTLNPVYDQTLRYSIGEAELRSRTLNVSVWHAEALGRNVFLGEVELTLATWDWSSTQPQWHPLQPRVQLNPDSISSRGTVLLSIKFTPAGSEGGGVPQTGELHIWLREAQGLLSARGGPVDSFIRSFILPDASRQSGQKTRMVKRSISPTYNHTMVYDGFHNGDLQEACAELTVWHRDGLKTHCLGGMRLSPGTGQSYGQAVSWMDSTEQEVSVWNSMMENPNHWIDTTLPIRTNLTQRPE